MLRPSLPARRVVGVALALSVGTGIGFGAYSLGSAAGANSSHLPLVTSSSTTGSTSTGSTSTGSTSTGSTSTGSTTTGTDAPGTSAGTPSSSETSGATLLTLEEVTLIAVEAAPPGRVVEIDEDNEPTGLRYDIKIQHDDGTSTDVEVDATTGAVTSIQHDNDWD